MELKGHIIGFGAAPKGTLGAPKGTVPFGKRPSENLEGMTIILEAGQSLLMYTKSISNMMVSLVQVIQYKSFSSGLVSFVQSDDTLGSGKEERPCENCKNS